MALSKKAQIILQLLVKEIDRGRFDIDDKTTFLGYKEAHDILGWTKEGRTWGDSLNNQGLGEVAKWAARNNFPAITGLIISKVAADDDKLHVPGGRYFSINEKDKDDLDWWNLQIADSLKKRDWSRHFASLLPPKTVRRSEVSQKISIVALDDDEYISEGEIIDAQGQKRHRNQRLRDAARKHFKDNHEWFCTVCNWVPPSELETEVLELHHKNPLSSYSQGKSVISIFEAIKNLVPVCPRCHRIIHSSKRAPYMIDDVKKIVMGI
jgi:hypothetical protein